MSTFRTKEEAQALDAPAETSEPIKPVEAKNQPLVKIPELLATYELDQGKPYTADYFDVGNVWQDSEEMARDIKEIEGYVRQQVVDGNVDNSTKAAEKFMRELERNAGLSRYESTNQRINKLLAYIDFKRTVNG